MQRRDLSHVAVFLNSSNPFHETGVRRTREAARSLRIKLQFLDVQKTEDLEGAFAAITKERPEAILVFADRVFLHNRSRIIDFIAKSRLPSVNAYREPVEAGGLMSFGPSYGDMHRRAAQYVHKILKGAKPADLPVEQPTKFELFFQCQSRQGARPNRAADAARPRRRGDRIAIHVRCWRFSAVRRRAGVRQTPACSDYLPYQRPRPYHPPPSNITSRTMTRIVVRSM
jgi:hypothetical protein